GILKDARDSVAVRRHPVDQAAALTPVLAPHDRDPEFVLEQKPDDREDAAEFETLPEDQRDPLTNLRVLSDPELAVLRRLPRCFALLVARRYRPIDRAAPGLLRPAVVLESPDDVRPVPTGNEPLEAEEELVGGIGRVVRLL